ncbi:N-acetyltransferase [Streptomyces ipomoeae]|jgi:RimJ/RimL family protein N-acetyltransferase|uniref:N-acetyltransferase n=1 Tax=Streptomyces ipomoeae TaxID=103232 RepID=A0AAE8VTY4_9ACTN|nr:GNAT family N-acetyltransferase [Streptomyces ipomoeae]MDX2827853.1 GNAT family N-acetyltransferase [Streptomyces ipomoeae]MDX2880291.1 GNAT family N-acetyltransferase [Streptomyces ipomoeae]TQE17177.1 N-acetyltransferase [Streptomyces ipomoeae]TQE23956.1 N-acetyltransferase [Streptomyces ipomoeae]
MEPVTLTTERLLLRTVEPRDTDSVYAAAQDPDIQRWTTIPSPYLREHAVGFVEQAVPEGWANASMFTFGVFLPSGELTGMLGITMRSLGTGEIGFWAVKEHRRNGYITEATLAAAHWAFTTLALDRLEWRAEVGNTASRAVAENTGFTLEGTLRAALNNNGTRRDCWIASLLPSDLGLPSTAPYLPSPTPLT